MEPSSRGVIMKRCRVAGEMAVTVVEWSCADVYVTDNDNLASLGDEDIDAFLEQKVIVHLEWETDIRCFVRAINVDKDKEAKVEHEGTSFRIQRNEIGRRSVVVIRHKFHFVSRGI